MSQASQPTGNGNFKMELDESALRKAATGDLDDGAVTPASSP